MPVVQRFAASLPPRVLPAPPHVARRGRAHAPLALAALLLAAVAAAAPTPVLQPPKIDPAVLARAADLAYSRDLTRARSQLGGADRLAG